MMKYSLLAILGLSAFSLALDTALGMGNQEVSVITNCTGVQVIRVSVGQFEVRHVEPNLPGCVNTTRIQTTTPVVLNVNTASTGTVLVNTGMTNTGITNSGSVIPHVVTNCNGTQILTLSGGTYAITHTGSNLPGCISSTATGKIVLSLPGINLSHGPLLDLASTDIVNYRIEQLKEQSIRFANVIRSVRMRRAASMQAKTNAYLMNNDAVVISGKETGWVKVQGADIVVTDTQENTIEADTTGKANGYTASKYLRDPNANDLVRVEQADQAYWSDLVHVNVHYVNVRSNPWYTAPIVTTLGNGTSMYVVATVDNWSEVRNDEGTIRGYIRSDYLTTDRAQRVDNPNTGKEEIASTPTESEVIDSSWIGF